MSAVAAVLVVLIFTAPMMATNVTALYPSVADVGNTQEVGMVLFTKYLIPFELAAVMLLVGMISGIVLAGKKMDKSLTLMNAQEIAEMQNETIKKALS